MLGRAPAALLAGAGVVLAMSGAAGSALSHETSHGPRRVPDQAPSWSPDGRYLVFYRGGAAFLARADGTRARRVADRKALIWSPNAQRLLVYSYYNGEIRLARSDGSGSWLVARGGRPSWAPDGRSFAFAWRSTIIVVDSSGTTVRRIQIPPGDGCPPSICGYRESEATWSPTAGTIAFVHITVWSGSKGSSSLLTVDSDGSNVQELPSQFAVTSPAWSPTGKQIAFLQYDDFEYEKLHVIDVAKRRNIELAPAWWFAWSPRGDVIVSIGSPNPDSDRVFAELVRLSDGWRRRLPRVEDVSWSPDGTRIAFERDGGIWVADRLGNRQRRVGTGRSPSWSPRGGTIAFAAAACGPRQGIWLLRVATGVAHRVSRGCRTVR